eukprot:7519474-Pyramimonas_sp.AAC.1
MRERREGGGEGEVRPQMMKKVAHLGLIAVHLLDCNDGTLLQQLPQVAMSPQPDLILKVLKGTRIPRDNSKGYWVAAAAAHEHVHRAKDSTACPPRRGRAAP